MSLQYNNDEEEICPSILAHQFKPLECSTDFQHVKVSSKSRPIDGDDLQIEI